ncbi:MAG: hypothetical protein COV07_00540 [Candidatus Vogelbacteria bacterium CG10_big_fil_rev_8_21_14_0_10_45_14]|uniref:Uncharacterized protein n=1 Tax=Candidatus Vogelbacteria bacterium CG10_big_fil_rev_8_21_14_0_10_45_14 TaxID=1975042 RepID=A0A2H0RL36_9BACT|nr:MAG: hypothetical protein COV07_00540 [Candidatus Vogelbacteria bacterium CG10_big_fil_rev_8_21_14_0_10_45_14]
MKDRKHFLVDETIASKEQRSLQDWVLRAYATDNKEQIAAARSEFEHLYPNHTDGISIMFDTFETLRDQSSGYQKDSGINREETRLRLLKKSANTIRTVEFLIASKAEHDFLEVFWKFLADIALSLRLSRDFQNLRRHVSSEAAVFHVFSNLGANPILPTPEEDVLKSVDLSIRGGKDYVQIKGVHVQRKPYIISMEEIRDPKNARRILTDIKEKHDGEWYGYMDENFRNLREYYHKVLDTDKTVPNVYLFFVPYSSYDPATCIPKSSLINYSKEYFKQDDKRSVDKLIRDNPLAAALYKIKSEL